MKKYLGLLLLLFTVTTQAQSFAKKFNVKEYANKQTEMIQSTLDLSKEQTEKVFKANMAKAHSIQKHFILYEQEGRLKGLNMKEALKTVNEDAERASGYIQSMKSILGDKLFEKFVDKFE